MGLWGTSIPVQSIYIYFDKSIIKQSTQKSIEENKPDIHTANFYCNTVIFFVGSTSVGNAKKTAANIGLPLTGKAGFLQKARRAMPLS